MSEVARFFAEVARNVEGRRSDPDLRALSGHLAPLEASLEARP